MLYHFTDSRNVASIREHGLLSWWLLDQKGISYVSSATELSHRLDGRRHLANYVHLCLRLDHPMAAVALAEGRVLRLVWLEIDEAVMRWRKTRFSDINATATGALITSDKKTALDSADPQAEVLVHNSLAAKWIRFPRGS